MALTTSSDSSSNPFGLAALILGVLFAFAFIPRIFAGGVVNPGEGKDAPAFSARIVGGTEGALLKSDELRGKPILLDFWATWCGPCKAEAPLIESVAKRFKDDGLVVVGVNTSDSERAAAQWVKSHSLTYPIVFDEGNDVAEAFGVASLPTMIVISKTGKVSAIRKGVTSEAELEKLVRQVL